MRNDKTMKRYYERYWEDIPAELADYKVKWPILSKFIPRENLTILDYGCGKGKILSDVRKINRKAVLYGADVSSIARQASKKSVPDAQILEIDENQKVPLKSASCDFILSLDVIEHIYDTDKAYVEFRRLLKRGGKLLLSTPYYGLIKNLIIAVIGFDIVYEPTTPHIRFYTKKSLTSILIKYGFTVKKFGYYGRFPFVWRGMYALAEKQS